MVKEHKYYPYKYQYFLLCNKQGEGKSNLGVQILHPHPVFINFVNFDNLGYFSNLSILTILAISKISMQQFEQFLEVQILLPHSVFINFVNFGNLGYFNNLSIFDNFSNFENFHAAILTIFGSSNSASAPCIYQFCQLWQFGLFQQFVNLDNFSNFENFHAAILTIFGSTEIFSNFSMLIILGLVRRNNISNFLRGHSLKRIFRLVYVISALNKKNSQSL